MQHVYRGRGACTAREIACEPADPAATSFPTIADTVPVSWIMSRSVTCARGDLDAGALVDVMLRARIGCVPIVDEDGSPIGMVTKLDLVEQLAPWGATTTLRRRRRSRAT